MELTCSGARKKEGERMTKIQKGECEKGEKYERKILQN